MKDASEASTVADVKAALEQLRLKHDAVTTRLDTSIAQHDELSRNLRRLDLSRARLGSLAVNARSISHGMLSGAASTATRISEAVERLDLEQERVKATLGVVEQVAELKSCVLGVMGSMGAPQDWETAAEYIHRASQIPADVIKSGFAEAVVPTAEVPDPPSVTLDEAAQSLCQLFLREFDKAVEEEDGAKITRFFKMFPLIGRSKEGLDAYGRYVRQGVAARARARLQTIPGTVHRDGFFFVNALTKLFEHIAQVVDGHSPLVERHYGAGTMIKVMERLHSEADIQGGIILDTWSEERAIDRKLTDVKSYAFSFLVQSFLPNQKHAAGTPRVQSPAVGVTANGVQNHEEDDIDMREIDQILNETGTMLGRWSLYVRFTAARSSAEDSNTNEPPPQTLTIPPFILDSNMPKKISKLLLDPFKTFSTFFLRRSVERAFQLDESPSGLSLNMNKPLEANPPFLTSAVDDVMYVVNQNLQRALATSQAEIVNATAATVGRVLGSDFIGMVQRKMRDESYPRAAIQGALPPEDKIISFLVLLNNLDVATDYIKRIVRAHADVETPSSTSTTAPEQDNTHNNNNSNRSTTGQGTSPPGKQLTDLFPIGRDAYTVRNALRALETSFTTKATELTTDGINVVFAQVVKPRVRPLLADAFRDAEYTSTGGENAADYDDALTRANDDDTNTDTWPAPTSSTVKSRLQPTWDSLIQPLKRILSPRNHDRLLSTLTAYLAALLERRLLSYHGRVTELGAVALERDVVDVVNVVVRGERFGVRDVFGRCLEIVTVMNLEEEEWEGGRGGEGGTSGGEGEVEAEGSGWVLDSEERVRARNMVRGRV